MNIYLKTMETGCALMIDLSFSLFRDALSVISHIFQYFPIKVYAVILIGISLVEH